MISFKEVSVESNKRQATATPASSVEFKMANVDPRLMEPHPLTLTTRRLSPSRPGTEMSLCSVGSATTNTDSYLASASTRKGGKLELGPKPACQPKYAT